MMLCTRLFILLCSFFITSTWAAQCSDVFPQDYIDKTTDTLEDIPLWTDWSPFPSTLVGGLTFARGESAYFGNVISSSDFYVADGTNSAVVYIYGGLNLLNTSLNEAGDPEDLVLVVDGAIDILANNEEVIINALIYSTGGLKIEANGNGNDVTINGAVRSAFGVAIGITESRGGKVNITYDPEAVEEADFGELCENTPAPAECPLSPLAGAVRINEVNKDEDWVELYVNHTSSLSIANWLLEGNGRGASTFLEYTCGLTDGCANQTYNTGDFIVIASSLSGSILEATQGSAPALIQGQNLFIDNTISLHNNTQEAILFDNNGDMVHYLRYENGNYTPEFEACETENPDDTTITDPPGGGEGGVCTLPDGSEDPNDWDKNCEDTPGEPNEEVGNEAVHHYEIILPVTESSVCADQVLTLKVCPDAACSTWDTLPDPAASFDLVTQAQGGSALVSAIVFNSAFENYTLSQDAPALVTITNQNASPNEVTICKDSAGNVLASCQIDFTTDYAFVWQAASYQSASCNDAVTTLKVKYYDTDLGQCGDLEGALNVDLDFTVTTDASQLNVTTNMGSNVNLIKGAEQAVNVTVGAAVVDNITLNYADAGQLTLTASNTGSNPFYISDSSSVLFYPNQIRIDEVTDTDGDGLFIAAEPFSYQIAAYCADGTNTPNYSPQALSFSATLSADGRASGHFTYKSGATAMAVPLAGNVYTPSPNETAKTFTAAQYNEYGQFSLTVSDTHYYGQVIGGQSKLLPDTNATFIADYLELSRTVTEASAEFSPHSASFNYVGKVFNYILQPQMRVKAFNANDEPLQNYLHRWQAGVSDVLATAEDSASGVLMNNSLVANETGISAASELGEYIYTLDDEDSYEYIKSITPISHFDSAITITIAENQYVDQDGRSNSTGFDMPTDALQMRYGRFYVQDASDVISGIASIRAQMQYLNGTNWLLSSDDNHSTLVVSNLVSVPEFNAANNPFNVSIIDATGGNSTRVTASWDELSVNGLFDFSFDHEDSANTGGQLIILWTDDGTTMPVYMQFAWDSANLSAPLDTKVAFGKKRGNDRIISWREID